jgi:hypothetical protein
MLDTGATWFSNHFASSDQTETWWASAIALGCASLLSGQMVLAARNSSHLIGYEREFVTPAR